MFPIILSTLLAFAVDARVVVLSGIRERSILACAVADDGTDTTTAAVSSRYRAMVDQFGVLTAAFDRENLIPVYGDVFAAYAGRVVAPVLVTQLEKPPFVSIRTIDLLDHNGRWLKEGGWHT